jgi:hypothetical protein
MAARLVSIDGFADLVIDEPPKEFISGVAGQIGVIDGVVVSLEQPAGLI